MPGDAINAKTVPVFKLGERTILPTSADISIVFRY